MAVGSFVLAGFTVGWGKAIASTLIGGTLGAGFGALSAHITGGDIKTGAMLGMLSGMISGNTASVGTWLAADFRITNYPRIGKTISFTGGVIAGGYAAAGGQLFEYGQIVDWTEILVKAGISGILNYLSFIVGEKTYYLDNSIKRLIEFALDTVSNGTSLFIDYIRSLRHEIWH